MSSLNIGEMAFVDVTFEKSRNVSHYVVPRNDLDDFFEAFVKLHYDPGVNPHNGVETSRICRIEARAMEVTYALWWTKPHLGVMGTPNHGARTITPGHTYKLWRSKEETARDDDNPGDKD